MQACWFDVRAYVFAKHCLCGNKCDGLHAGHKCPILQQSQAGGSAFFSISHLALSSASIMVNGLHLPSNRQPSNTLVAEPASISDRLLQRGLSQRLPVVLCFGVCVESLPIRCLYACTYRLSASLLCCHCMCKTHLHQVPAKHRYTFV